MKNKLLVAVLCGFFIILCYLLSNKYLNKKENIINENVEIIKVNRKLTCKKIEKKSEGQIKNITLFDENEKSIKIQQLSINTPKIIFRFNEMDCRSCLEEEFSNISKISELVGRQNIVIIADYNNPRLFKIFIEQNKITIPIYNCEDLNLEIEKHILSPFVFVLDKNNVKDVHYLDKLQSMENSQYYKFILEKYFEVII